MHHEWCRHPSQWHDVSCRLKSPSNTRLSLLVFCCYICGNLRVLINWLTKYVLYVAMSFLVCLFVCVLACFSLFSRVLPFVLPIILICFLSFFLSFFHPLRVMHTQCVGVYRNSYRKSPPNAFLHSTVFTVRILNLLYGRNFEYTRINAGGFSLRFCGISYPNAVQMFGVQKWMYFKILRFLKLPRSPNPTFPIGSSHCAVLCSAPWAVPVTPALPIDHCISCFFPATVRLWH